jgi:hypothetical protein
MPASRGVPGEGEPNEPSASSPRLSSGLQAPEAAQSQAMQAALDRTRQRSRDAGDRCGAAWGRGADIVEGAGMSLRRPSLPPQKARVQSRLARASGFAPAQNLVLPRGFEYSVGSDLLT